MKRHYDLAQEELSFYGNDSTSLQNILAILIGPKADPTRHRSISEFRCL